MATVPGVAEDFVSHWRQGKSDGESLLGALKGFPDMR
jgi:hypothetical protein